MCCGNGDTRDYFTEALHIINGTSLLLPERAHLLALYHFVLVAKAQARDAERLVQS